MGGGRGDTNYDQYEGWMVPVLDIQMALVFSLLCELRMIGQKYNRQLASAFCVLKFDLWSGVLVVPLLIEL